MHSDRMSASRRKRRNKNCSTGRSVTSRIYRVLSCWVVTYALASIPSFVATNIVVGSMISSSVSNLHE